RASRRRRSRRRARGGGRAMPRGERPAGDRRRQRGAQPPVLPPPRQLRPAVEPDADRAAHRPAAPHRADRARRGPQPLPRRLDRGAHPDGPRRAHQPLRAGGGRGGDDPRLPRRRAGFPEARPRRLRAPGGGRPRALLRPPGRRARRRPPAVPLRQGLRRGALPERAGRVTTSVADFLRLYVAALGGVVDDEPGGLRALLPSDAAAALESDDEVVLATDAPPGDGAVDARLGSAFLERCIRARRARTPLAGVALPGERPRPARSGRRSAVRVPRCSARHWRRSRAAPVATSSAWPTTTRAWTPRWRGRWSARARPRSGRGGTPSAGCSPRTLRRGAPSCATGSPRGSAPSWSRRPSSRPGPTCASSRRAAVPAAPRAAPGA